MMILRNFSERTGSERVAVGLVVFGVDIFLRSVKDRGVSVPIEKVEH